MPVWALAIVILAGLLLITLVIIGMRNQRIRDFFHFRKKPELSEDEREQRIKELATRSNQKWLQDKLPAGQKRGSNEELARRIWEREGDEWLIENTATPTRTPSPAGQPRTGNATEEEHYHDHGNHNGSGLATVLLAVIAFLLLFALIGGGLAFAMLKGSMDDGFKGLDRDREELMAMFNDPEGVMAKLDTNAAWTAYDIHNTIGPTLGNMNGHLVYTEQYALQSVELQTEIRDLLKYMIENCLDCKTQQSCYEPPIPIEEVFYEDVPVQEAPPQEETPPRESPPKKRQPPSNPPDNPPVNPPVGKENTGGTGTSPEPPEGPLGTNPTGGCTDCGGGPDIIDTGPSIGATG